jgi:hypothetical protein
MTGLQTAFGLVLTGLAAWQLRPVFRRQAGSAERGQAGRDPGRWRWRRAARTSQPVRLLGWKPCLDEQPALWKELLRSRGRGLLRWIGFALTAIGGSYLAYYTIWYAGMALAEWWDFGSSPPFDISNPSVSARLQQWHTLRWQRANGFSWIERSSYLDFLGWVVPLPYLLGVLAVAGAAAASITAEHEGDTWASLTSTDLTGREIVTAKLLGALRRGIKFAGVILLMAAIGAVAGALHPLSFPALAIALLTYGFFAAAFGTWISLQVRSTWRAQFLTVTGLLLINVAGQGLINAFCHLGVSPQAWPGFTPYEISKLVLPPYFSLELAAVSWPRLWPIPSIDDGTAWLTIFSVVSVLGYVALAVLLYWHSLRRFEVLAGRARRSRRRPQAKPARAAGTENQNTFSQPDVFATSI